MPKLKGYAEGGWFFLRHEDGTVWMSTPEMTIPGPTDGPVRIHTTIGPDAWTQIVKALGS